jgi:lysophospholipase L1-like esterase
MTMKSMLFRAAVSAGVLTALAVSPLFSQTTFHKYVALGDSLTAGVEGVCLVERHQNHSYPKLVADQLGISDFQQPLLSERAFTDASTPACRGAVVAGGTITVGFVSQTGHPTNLALPRPYDNLGVPGANTADLVDLKVSNPAGNTANLAATVILRNFPGGPFENRSAVDEANLLNPDLVTVWAGPGDILGAELSAVAIEGVTLTPVAVFEAKYTQLMAAISGTGRTIVALNIPEETNTPFTTTIPPVVLDSTTGHPVSLLGPRTTPTCSTAPCPIPADTLVTLGASSLLAQGMGIPSDVTVEFGGRSVHGTGQALPDGSFSSSPATLIMGVLLYPDEVALMRQRTSDLNAKIASIAAANGATVFDAHALYEEIFAHGYEVGGGIVVTNAFLTGGVFSADGFHPTNIGYAIVAKEILQHLNSVKGTDFELPDMAEAIFAPDTPVLSTSAVVEPAAGPFGYSMQMWKDLIKTASPVAHTFDLVFPTSGKRVPRLLKR